MQQCVTGWSSVLWLLVKRSVVLRIELDIRWRPDARVLEAWPRGAPLERELDELERAWIF